MRGKAAAVESSVLGLDEAQLPLTPAISLGERENRFPHWQRLGAAGEEQDSTFIFPLPRGEGGWISVVGEARISRFVSVCDRFTLSSGRGPG